MEYENQAKQAVLLIRTLGTLQTTLDGEDLTLPASRKTRALLGYLALSGAPQRRDRLCELFWEIPDDPRGALRWSLSKLRPVVNRGSDRLIADRERVQIDATSVCVDFMHVRACANNDAATLNELDAAWEDANQLLMEDCELPNQPDFTIWLEHQRNELAKLRAKLAKRITTCGELGPEDAEKWAQRWLDDAPFDPEAAHYAVAAKRRLGRTQQASQLAEDIDAALHDAGVESPDWTSDPFASVTASSIVVQREEEDLSAPRQIVRFVQAEDNSSLAWASVGSAENPPLVKAANWLSHLELDWEAPIWSPLFRELGKSFNFIRYDERGNGLSDWDVPEISFESFVTDLEIVVDAAGLDRFPLLGISQGAAVSIEYAARHPERVSHLILFGGYAAGWRHIASPEEVREREAMMVLTETGWGRTNPSYRHLFSQTFMPDASSEELAWFDEFQRRTASAENAVRFLQAFADLDVRHRLAEVQCPTLVIHSRNDLRIPMASGRSLAAQIPNAEFVGLDSNNHLLIGREPASAEFIRAVRRFLSGQDVAVPAL